MPKLELDSINDIQDIILNADGSYTIKYKEYQSKSGARLVETSWTNVPHYNKKGRLLKNEEYKTQTIAKYGKQYFAQTEECEFLGSASTLISTEALKLMTPMTPIRKDNIFSGVKIYHEPIPKHNYTVSVDPSKDGIDSFAVQVTDITKFPFIQVASAKLDVDYLMMPEHLDLLGRYYNEAFMVIENNEGAGQSVADTLFMTYEYPNLYRDRDPNNRGYKKFYGFRTTKGTRPLILNMMKIFIEEGKYIVNDESTISEFFNFIKSDKLSEKFAAEEGYHDDLVMSLAIGFAPFMHNKAFDDYELFLSTLRLNLQDDGDDVVDTSDFYSLLDTSGFDDGSSGEVYTKEQALMDIRGGVTDPLDFNAAMDSLRF